MPLAAMLGCELILPPPTYYVSADGAGGAGGHGGSGGGAKGPGGAGGVGGCASAFPLSSGAGGANDACCGSSAVLGGGCKDYELLHVSSHPPDIDGCCDDPVWQVAKPIEFRGPPVLGFEDASYTCRLLWSGTTQMPSQPAVLYGCCEVRDTSLAAGALLNGTSPTAIVHDDGFEYLFAGMRQVNADTLQTFMNINRKTSTADPMSAAPGVIVEVSTQGNANDTTADEGYTLEWKGPIALKPIGSQLFCQFALHDRTQADPTNAGTKFACGGSMADTSPPDWALCTFSSTPAD
jgi:hypothetical protein